MVTSADKVYRLDWASKRSSPATSFDLSPHGIADGRAVDVIDDQVYVLNGAGQVDLTVFNVITGLGAPSNLTATLGTGRST